MNLATILALLSMAMSLLGSSAGTPMQPTAINIANQAVSTAYQWIEQNTAALAPATTSSTSPAPIINQPVATATQPMASASAPDVPSSQATSSSDIGGNQSAPQVVAPTQTTTTIGSLSAVQNTNFSNPVVTAGTSNQEIASFVLIAQTNSVSLNDVRIVIPSSVPNGWLSDMYVTIGGKQFGNTISSAPGGGTYIVNGVTISQNSYTFSGLPIMITPNSSVVMNVYASISKGTWNPSQDFADLFEVMAMSIPDGHGVSLSSTITGQNVTVK